MEYGKAVCFQLSSNEIPLAGNVPGDQKAFVLNRRLRNRITTYMRRFCLPSALLTHPLQSDEVQLLTTTKTSDIACLKKHLSQSYEEILSTSDPHRGLVRTINTILIGHREETEFLNEMLCFRERVVGLKDKVAVILPAVVDNLRENIKNIEADLKEKAYSREFEIYLIQLGAARSKLYELDSIACNNRCRVLEKSTKLVEYMLFAQSSSTPHQVCIESHLKSYAQSLKAISQQYKGRVSEISGIREVLRGLEGEVQSLNKLKNQLRENCSDEDPVDVIRRYNDLGQQKLKRMESVTEAVQELKRHLAQKRNILSPKLNELDRMRSEVQDMEQRIRDRERGWGIERQQDENLRGKHAQAIQNQVEITEELNRTLFQIEFFKYHITSDRSYVSEFGDLSHEEATAVIQRIHKLSHLLHTPNP